MGGLRKVRYSGICFYEHESHADAGILAVDGVCFVFCHLKSLIEAAFFFNYKKTTYLTSHITINIKIQIRIDDGGTVPQKSGIVCFPACGQHHHQLECEE